MLPFKRTFIFILACSGFGIAAADTFPEDYLNAVTVETRQGVVTDVSPLAEGEMDQVEFAGGLIYIYRRTAQDLKDLERSAATTTVSAEDYLLSVRQAYGSSISSVWARLLLLAEPLATQLPTRSVSRELMVMSGASPATGYV